jgi:hypothetical protein
MDTMNAFKHLVLASAAVVLAVAIGVFWLVGGKKPSRVVQRRPRPRPPQCLPGRR